MELAKRKLVDLQSYVAFMGQHNHLIRVKSEVDADFELAGIARKYEGGKAVLGPSGHVSGHRSSRLVTGCFGEPGVRTA